MNLLNVALAVVLAYDEGAVPNSASSCVAGDLDHRLAGRGDLQGQRGFDSLPPFGKCRPLR
jgi:hypothetical protein